MKKMRLLLATFTASVLLSISALAATAQISFSDPTAELGQEVDVTMKVRSTDGTLSRADITLHYDTTALEFVSGTDADGGAGSVRVHGASSGSGTGTLEYSLKFRTLSAGQGKVSIATQEVYDTDESIVQITHNGNSTVSIQGAQSASNDASLQELTVSPGELSPAFATENTNYEIAVGTDVTTLAINALTADSGAKVSISGNESLNIGENTVTITVTAADGSTQAVYTILVKKQEGEENAQTETTNEGVKLSSKDKTITIMNPGSEVEVPEGFAESTIDIDGHQVRGWVWKADENHEYCIVYGMNDAGDLNFYRYDLTEKTIQRYFSDPVGTKLQQNAEDYPALEARYNALVTRYNTQFILSCIMSALALILAGAMVLVIRASRMRYQAAIKRDRNTAPKENEVGVAATVRPAAKRSGVVVEDLEATRPITDLASVKTEAENSVEDDLEATRPITDLSRAALGATGGLEVEDLEATGPISDPSHAASETAGAMEVEDLGATRPISDLKNIRQEAEDLESTKAFQFEKLSEDGKEMTSEESAKNTREENSSDLEIEEL